MGIYVVFDIWVFGFMICGGFRGKGGFFSLERCGREGYGCLLRGMEGLGGKGFEGNGRKGREGKGRGV